MSKYKVSLCRMYHLFAEVEVDAANEDEAEEIALSKANDADFHGMQWNGETTVEGVTEQEES